MKNSAFVSLEQFISESNHDLYYVMELPSGVYSYISPSVEQISGYPHESFLKNPLLIREIIHPDWHPFFEREWRQLLEGTPDDTYKYPIMTKTGEERWLFQRNRLVKDENGKPAALLGLVTDITEVLDEELQKYRQELATFANTSNDWIWEVDEEGRYTYVSDRAKDFLGYEPEELIGLTPFHLMSEAEAARVGELFLRYIHKHESFKYLRNTNLHKDGHEIVLETSGVPIFDDEGNFTGYRGTDRDITRQVEHENAIEAALSRYDAMLSTTQDGVWIVDAQNARILDTNDAYVDMSGYSKDELLEMTIPQLEAKEKPEETRKRIRYIIDNGNDLFTSQHRRKNGETYDVEVVVSFSEIEEGRFFVFIRDITKRKENEARLQLASKVFSTMKDGVIITDTDTNIIEVNDAFCDITGYSREELIGQQPGMLSSGWHDKKFYEAMWSKIHREGSWQGEVVDRKKNGHVYTSESSIVSLKDDAGNITHYIAVSNDISKQKEREEIINNLAYYDALTKFPNRLHFEEHCSSRIASAKRHKTSLALLFIDLDNFKTINDTHGHLVGDRFLQEAASKFTALLREEDTIGRFGGDEFAILIEAFNTPSSVAEIARKIAAAFNEPFYIDDIELFSGASIGIALYPEDGKNYQDLLRNADTAMYQVKGSGKGGHAFFNQMMNDSLTREVTLINGLRQALQNDEFSLHFQPIVESITDKITGAEALIRWKHPTLGKVSPAEFVPLLERNGMIVDVGNWVFEEVCRYVARLYRNFGYHSPYISVNVSTLQLTDTLYGSFGESLERHGVNPEHIVLEITETSVVNDPEKSYQILRRFADDGFKIAIDDFGTGYSSMLQLIRLPFHKLKIDKVFIDAFLDNSEHYSLVTSMIHTAKSLNKRIIAEGVETPEQLFELNGMHIDAIQGYVHYKPMPFEELIGALKRNKQETQKEAEKLYRIIYVSDCSHPLEKGEMADIIKNSKMQNQSMHITGLLVYTGSHFMQYIEGSEENVISLYRKILKDPRHTNVEILDEGHAEQRLFVKWGMGFWDKHQSDILKLANYRNDPHQARIFFELLAENYF